MIRLLSAVFFMATATLVAATVPYQEYILAPTSRIIRPVAVFRTDGPSTNPEALLIDNVGAGKSLVLTAFNASVTYDFRKNIAGYANVKVSSTTGVVGVTFSESSLFISSYACDSIADAGPDEPLLLNVTGAGHYAAPPDKLRGAFRYLTVVNRGEGNLTVNDLWVEYTAMPHWDDLRNYTGWFHSDDEKLNRVWYAGAYTNQLVTIDPKRGGAVTSGGQLLPDGTTTWWLNTTITNGTSTFTDGAKRDRLVWAGDMSIAVPSIMVSTYDLISIRNALESVLSLQNAAGMFPYHGNPVDNTVSFTYHLHTLINLYNYYQWSGDLDFITGIWDAWTAGMAWATAQIDDSGLANVTSSADWLRSGMGGHNIEANGILLYTLDLGVTLASIVNDTTSMNSWKTLAAAIPPAAQARLWQQDVGLFRDNDDANTTLAPQDGNAWAIKSGIVKDPAQAVQISAGLQARWTEWGAPAPEAQEAVSPFASGFELEAHFMANRTETALALIRSMWADVMLDDPRMTNSTFIEGYSASGDIHYPPYASSSRISFAHGWASGPTGSLTSFVAGIQILTEAGSTWAIAPQPGDLTKVGGGIITVLGPFSSKWSANGTTFHLQIRTPDGTTGTVGLPLPGNSTEGRLKTDGEGSVTVQADSAGRFWLEGVSGGEHDFVVTVM